MVTSEKILKKPRVAKSLIGKSLSEFDKLFADFENIHTERQSGIEHTRHHKSKRQRAVGAGRKSKYGLRDRLLMTLFPWHRLPGQVWLRAYMTFELLGFFYDLDKTNIEDNLKDVLNTLEAITDFNFERPSAERTQLRSVQEVMDAFPDVRLILDAKEQRIERPASKKDKDGKVQDRQKPYYSGKKKTHTLKNQIAVAPNGRIEDASESVPGGANHGLTLLRQTNLLAKLAHD